MTMPEVSTQVEVAESSPRRTLDAKSPLPRIMNGWPHAGRVACMVLTILAGLLMAPAAEAQSGVSPQTLADTWQGTLHAGRDLRTVVKITKADAGYKSLFYSIDQGAQPIPVTSTTLDGSTVKMSLDAIGGKYEGKLSPDGKTIDGTWTQGPNPLPLVLTRATPETAWAIPEPPPRLAPMAVTADPSFEVATIKPTKPDEKSKMLVVQGRQFKTVNISLDELIAFSYGIHAKQIVGAPAWFAEDHYDITAVPDAEGAPNAKQLKTMIQKMLTERFKFTFHRDKKELSVYVLTVAKSGQKMNKSDGDANSLPGFSFPALGTVNVQNAMMGEFASFMQETVLDRPVLDQTGLAGKWGFILKWTPDDSQFGGMGAKIPPSTDTANAPPALFTAIQEQVGLKLDATRAPAEVFVIDHVEKPSAN